MLLLMFTHPSFRGSDISLQLVSPIWNALIPLSRALKTNRLTLGICRLRWPIVHWEDSDSLRPQLFPWPILRLCHIDGWMDGWMHPPPLHPSAFGCPSVLGRILAIRDNPEGLVLEHKIFLMCYKDREHLGNKKLSLNPEGWFRFLALFRTLGKVLDFEIFPNLPTISKSLVYTTLIVDIAAEDLKPWSLAVVGKIVTTVRGILKKTKSYEAASVCSILG